MRRVLIVDDDRLFADALDDDLVSWGYAVETVFDPSALRVRLEGDAPGPLDSSLPSGRDDLDGEHGGHLTDAVERPGRLRVHDAADRRPPRDQVVERG